MPDFAKILIFAGLALLVAGIVFYAAGRMGFRGMPGDVAYRGDNVRVYFPIVSCIVLSVLLTAGLWLWQWLTRR
ncbi:MAG TPA: DUF2905 domain-containing protein [Tepidisphaeraceae bacterium]